MSGPQTIDEAITDYSGFYPADAVGMSDDDIRAYFKQANFTSLFGEENGVNDWPWSFEQLGTRAVEMVRELNEGEEG